MWARCRWRWASAAGGSSSIWAFARACATRGRGVKRLFRRKEGLKWDGRAEGRARFGHSLAVVGGGEGVAEGLVLAPFTKCSQQRRLTRAAEAALARRRRKGGRGERISPGTFAWREVSNWLQFQAGFLHSGGVSPARRRRRGRASHCCGGAHDAWEINPKAISLLYHKLHSFTAATSLHSQRTYQRGCGGVGAQAPAERRNGGKGVEDHRGGLCLARGFKPAPFTH
jgi:hypothetical protein